MRPTASNLAREIMASQGIGYDQAIDQITTTLADAIRRFPKLLDEKVQIIHSELPVWTSRYAAFRFSGQPGYRTGQVNRAEPDEAAPGEPEKPSDAEPADPWIHTGSIDSPGTVLEIHGEGGPQRQAVIPTADEFYRELATQGEETDR